MRLWRRIRIAGLLMLVSILYLRCAVCIRPTAPPQALVSILYLRCPRASRSGAAIGRVSILYIEMQPYGSWAFLAHLFRVSILYLRCRGRCGPSGRRSSCWSFNSLFEMPNFGSAATDIVTLLEGFNSLFEMQHRRRRSRRLAVYFEFQFSI